MLDVEKTKNKHFSEVDESQLSEAEKQEINEVKAIWESLWKKLENNIFNS